MIPLNSTAQKIMRQEYFMSMLMEQTKAACHLSWILFLLIRKEQQKKYQQLKSNILHSVSISTY